MSSCLKPTVYNGRGLETQWINLVFQSHELICGCNDPQTHFNTLINNQKCHHSTEGTTIAATTGTIEKDETGFDAGDLEALFAENQEDAG